MAKTFTRNFSFPGFFFFLLLFYAAAQPASSQAPGSGNTLLLDGVNDYVDAGFDNRGITSQVTVEAWIKTSSSAYQWVASKYSNTQGEDAGYHLYTNNGRAAFNGRDGSGNYRSSGMSATVVADNRWHHLAGVCRNGRWEIYVDGVLESSLNTGYTQVKLTTVHSPLTIGNYYIFNENYFRGQIDEVRVWKSSRSQEEIRKFMCQKLSGSEANLVAYFTADEASPNTLKDASASRASGQLKNFGTGAFVVSGAPLGNDSRAFYTSNWSTVMLEIAGSSGQETFQVFSPSASIKGIHLYRVDAVPNTRAGIGNGDSPPYYYGVFTVGSSQQATYTVNYKAYQTSSCYSLYSRADNAQLNWALLPTFNAPTASTLNKAGESYRGEYLLNTNEAPKLEVNGPVSICNNTSAVLTAAGTGSGSYLWNTGAVTPAISIDKPGTYTVRFTLPGGCYSEATHAVTAGSVPAFSLGPDTVLCDDGSYVLRAPAGAGLSFRWQDGSAGAALNVAATGWYWLEVAQNGCARRDSVHITYAPRPVVNLGRDTTMCVGRTLQLSAGQPGLKYRWQDGATAPSYAVTAAGTYWVDVENAAGCVSRDSIRVVFLTPPVVSLGRDTTLCAGQQLTLNKYLPGVRYLWQDGSSQPAFTITGPGKYWVRASLDVCAESDTILVSYQPNPPVVFSGDTVLCRGSKLLLTVSVPGATFLWQDGSTASSLLVEQEGTYAVTVRQGGCTTTSTKRVLYRDCEPFIPNIITPNADARNETFFIRNIEPREWALEIYNRWGQRVYQASRYGNDWAAKDLADGVYYYKLSQPGQGRTYKGYVEVVR